MAKKKLCFLTTLSLISFISLFAQKIFAEDSHSDWQMDTPLPYESSGNRALVIGDKLYNFGGGNSLTYHTEILSAEINKDGSISSWNNKGQMPLNITWHSVATKGNNVWLVGGAIPSPQIPNVTSTDSVYSAQLDSLGNIGLWTKEPSLPQKLARNEAFVYKDRIYSIGGVIHNNISSESVVDSVYFANIFTDGSIGSWVKTNSLPQPRAEFALFIQNNIVYVVDGMQNSGMPANTVYKGTINDDTGEIFWEIDASTPITLRRPAFTLYKNTAYMIGGYDGSVFKSTTYSASVINGVMSEWKAMDMNLSGGSCCNSAVGNNNVIYLIGRHDGQSYYPDVFHFNIISFLNVPDLKQNFIEWANAEYDTAHKWSASTDTISRYGCALTSATMILRYYGYNVTPLSLNAWLLQNHGYVGDGYLNWSSISKWVKINHEINPLLKTVEYSMYKFDTSRIDSELNNNNPVIIKLVRADGGTHFVVATGKENNDYRINDPATEHNLLSSYPSLSYNQIEVFTPSNTNLSYLYFYTSSNVKFSVINPYGNPILNHFFDLNPYIDQISQTSSNQKKLNSFSLEKPSEGDYYVRVSGSGQYFSEGRIYGLEGDLSIFSSNEKIKKGNINTYLLHFGGKSNIVKIDFSYIRVSLANAYHNNLIKNKLLFNSLLVLLNAAEKAEQHDRSFTSKDILRGLLSEIVFAKKMLDNNYQKQLTKNINYLIESI